MKNDHVHNNPDTPRLALYDWVQCIVAPVVCAILIFTFIIRVNGIQGPSMMQTLQDGDTVLLSHLFFAPRHGDIVYIKTEKYGDTPIVKRVIGIAGQTINIDFSQGLVYLDGEALQEDYTNTPTTLREDFSGPVTVPEGCIFVMGDNRNISEDSRSDAIGFIDTRQILGKVVFVLIPGKSTDGTRHWDRFGVVS